MPTPSDKQVAQVDDGDAIISGRPFTFTKHPDLTSAVMHSQDPFIHALLDARRANERALQIGMTRQYIVNQRYYNDIPTGQDMLSELSYVYTGASARNLDGLLHDLWTKIQSASIYKLPTELMCLVFSNLDMDSLFTCRATCRLWAEILASNAARKEVWYGTSVVLKGSSAEIDARWRAACRSQVIPSSLLLWISSISYGAAFLPQTDGFLTSILKEVKYGGSPSDGLDRRLWKSIARCSGLKLLHWTIWDRDYRPYDSDSHSDSYDSNTYEQPSIPNCLDVGNEFCKLEEFRLVSGQYIRIDVAFVQMLCQVKRLHITSGLSTGHVHAILKTAQNHLEDVSIARIGNLGNNWVGPVPAGYDSASDLLADRLQRLSVQGGENLHGIRITAPHLATLHFGPVNALDWALLDSCRKELKSLRIDILGEKTTDTLGRELFDMPHLEFLHLDYRRDVEYGGACRQVILGYYEDYSAAAFWDAITGNDIEKIQVMLPRLKNLRIVHDPLLDEEALILLIEARRLAGHPDLEHVEILLANHCDEQTDQLDNLAKIMPGFKYQHFQDWWEYDSSKWWTLTTDLKWQEGLDWIEIDVCRGILVKLNIWADKAHQRLGQELFNMPKLEELCLHLHIQHYRQKEESSASAAALWSAVSTGNSGDPDIPLRDILPSLTTLRVYNDAQLDEHVIISMIKMRESLDLPPIERMTITLATQHSRHHARLDALKETMPGFSYDVYHQK